MKLNNTLPPWGLLDQDYLDRIARQPIPPDWRLKPNNTPKLQEWMQWRDNVIKGIAQMLWPIYTPAGPGSAAGRVAALNDADFLLLKKLALHFDEPIASRYQTTVTHSVLFAEEDSSTIGLGSHYERYDPLLPSDLRAKLPSLLQEGFRHKVGTYSLQIKQKLQRPRPYQVAFLQSRPGFKHQPAESADTPSMCSGHCLQGSLSGCRFFEEAWPKMSPSSIELLQQFTVDIGDRRVFAGVHYPSDNLSSWWAALNVIPRVFGPKEAPRILDFLSGAIIGKSLVFAAILEHVQQNKTSSPYAAMVEKILEFSAQQ